MITSKTSTESRSRNADEICIQPSCHCCCNDQNRSRLPGFEQKIIYLIDKPSINNALFKLSGNRKKFGDRIIFPYTYRFMFNTIVYHDTVPMRTLIAKCNYDVVLKWVTENPCTLIFRKISSDGKVPGRNNISGLNLKRELPNLH